MAPEKIESLALGGFEGEIKELRTPAGLIIDSLRLSLGPTLLQTEPFSLSVGSPGPFEARVTPEALQIFLNEQAPGGARDFQVTFEGGQIRIGATARVLIEVRAEAVCKFRIEKSKQLFVDLISADVLGIGASGIIERQLEAINPVLDVSAWPLPLQLESVQITPEFIAVKGSLIPQKQKQ